MKKLIVYILLVGFYGLASAHEGHPQSLQQERQSVVYTCPMHPEVQEGKPGNCPKCGMKLVVEKKKSVPTKNGVPIRRNQPAKVGDMGEMKMSTHGKTVDKSLQLISYTCTMHPEIHVSKPGNCPKCGMKLVQEAAKTMPTRHDGIDRDIREDAKRTDITENKKGMQLGDDDDIMENIIKAKAYLGPIVTKSHNLLPRTIRYDLYVADTTVTFGKKSKRAIAVNGQIPMPTLTFTEGDTALIYVHNNLDEETSLHWHGLFLPNNMDGVPFLTQMPIMPHSTYIYKFPIVQHGTHWYHSHSMLQEQIGMYGAFILNKRKEWDIPTIPITLSEWTDMKPEEVHRSLKNATDWFAIQKGATQNYTEAIKSGNFKTKVNNEWKRMTAMDVSDVFYDNFLINGKNRMEQPRFRAGDKVRLRIANGGASDYFWLNYAGGKITVVATDGNDVEPVEVDRLIIAVSETYDVVLTIPENKSYEFLVTPEDRTGSASLWLGTGEKVSAMKLKRPKYFAGMKMMNEMIDMHGNMIEMGGMKMQNQTMDMNAVMYPEITGEELTKVRTSKSHAPEMQVPSDKSMAGMNMASESNDLVTLNYNMLRDPNKTILPKGKWRELRFDLTGNMNRYVWTLDNKTVSESDKILIKQGENVRIIIFNNSMMRHPMHLHGHDFRVLNGQGENAPMKNVIDIMPMERDTIEFAASERGGDWFFHCHILYHMMSGMGRVFSYENSQPNPEIPDPKFAWRKLSADDRGFHPMASIGLESNGSDGELMFSNTRYRLSTAWRIGTKSEHGLESETYFGHFIGRLQWLMPFIGFDYHYNGMHDETENNLFGQLSNQKNRKAAVIGVQYLLPMLVTAEARLDSKGKLRFQLMREDIPLTSRLRLNFMANTDREYMAGFRYILTKYFSLSTHYDSDMGYAGGLTVTY